MFNRKRAAPRAGILLPTLVGALGVAGGLALLSFHNGRRARRAETGALARQEVVVGDVELAFVERGSGPVLVLLHGNGTSIEDFETSGLIETAAATHRVIALDRPGFGASTRPAGTLWTAAQQADCIDAALERLGISRYLVLGHSFGASVALECALRHSGRVAGLIAISGYYYPEPRPSLAFAATPALPFFGTLLRRTLLPVAARLAWPKVMAKLFRPAAVSVPFSAALRELATRPEQLRAIAADSAVLIAERLSIGDYGTLRIPTGILAGEGDAIIDAKAMAERLASDIPEARLVIVPGVGHMLHHSAPDAVLAMIDTIDDRADLRRNGSD